MVLDNTCRGFVGLAPKCARVHKRAALCADFVYVWCLLRLLSGEEEKMKFKEWIESRDMFNALAMMILIVIIAFVSIAGFFYERGYNKGLTHMYRCALEKHEAQFARYVDDMRAEFELYKIELEKKRWYKRR